MRQGGWLPGTGGQEGGLRARRYLCGCGEQPRRRREAGGGGEAAAGAAGAAETPKSGTAADGEKASQTSGDGSDANRKQSEQAGGDGATSTSAAPMSRKLSMEEAAEVLEAHVLEPS